MIKFIAITVFCSVVLCVNPSVNAQDNKTPGSFLGESSFPAVKSGQSGQITIKDTSRERPPFFWGPLNLPDSGQLSQRLSNLKVTVIEQKSAGGGVQTLYVASGTYVNATEDDKTHVPATWTINFLDKNGTAIDSFSFDVSHDHCSYNGEEPFNSSPRPSAFNLFDAIASATASGHIPAGYRGGC